MQKKKLQLRALAISSSDLTVNSFMHDSADLHRVMDFWLLAGFGHMMHVGLLWVVWRLCVCEVFTTDVCDGPSSLRPALLLLLLMNIQCWRWSMGAGLAVTVVTH